jgi:hypothetical protein
MISKVFAWVLMFALLGTLAACRPALPPTRAETGTPSSVVPRSTVPPGVDPDAIRATSPEELATLQSLAREQEARVMGIQGTYAAQVPGENGQSYHVEENAPFIGHFELWHSYDETREFALICLLDHRQTPCAPDAPLLQHVILQPFEHLTVPLETPALSRGLHDFSVTYWPDPYLDPEDPAADSRILDFATDRDRVSLFVGGDPTPPEVAVERLTGTGPSHEIAFVNLHLREDPFGPYGGIEYLTHLQAAPDAPVEFYVHLNNWLEANADMDVAVTAFVDYQQVPLLRNGVPHTPLYVEVPAGTWQPVAVQLQAPSEPGLYELVIVGTLFPYARMDEFVRGGKPQGVLQELGVALLRAHTSARILLGVE